MAGKKQGKKQYDLGPHQSVQTGDPFKLANGEVMYLLRFFNWYNDLHLVLTPKNYLEELDTQGYSYVALVRPKDVEQIAIRPVQNDKER
jgi:hypothetical protein